MKEFKNGDRVVFLGDSLVHQNYYTSLIIDGYKRLRPESKVDFYVCGTAGGTAEFALNTLNEDTLSYSPTHVVICFGVNDSRRWVLEGGRSAKRYGELTEAFGIFKKSIDGLVRALEERGISVILCTPAPYDEYSEGEEALRGGHALVCGFADFVRDYAVHHGIPLVDYHTLLTEASQTERVIGDDHIHPVEHGYYLMAKYFLSLQGMDIGSEKPLPEYFSAWQASLNRLRRIYAAECMIICHSGLSESRRIEFMRNYIDKGARNEYFENIAREYVENKPKQEQIREEMLKIYENDVQKR